MSVLKSISKQDDIYVATQLVSDHSGFPAIKYIDYKEDFSEVRYNSGLIGNVKGEWETCPISMKEDVFKHFPDLNKKVKINLKIKSSCPFRTEYETWTCSMGDLMNNQTGTIVGITVYERHKDPVILVKIDKPFTDPNFNRQKVTHYHFSLNELIFV